MSRAVPQESRLSALYLVDLRSEVTAFLSPRLRVGVAVHAGGESAERLLRPVPPPAPMQSASPAAEPAAAAAAAMGAAPERAASECVSGALVCAICWESLLLSAGACLCMCIDACSLCACVYLYVHEYALCVAVGRGNV